MTKVSILQRPNANIIFTLNWRYKCCKIYNNNFMNSENIRSRHLVNEWLTFLTIRYHSLSVYRVRGLYAYRDLESLYFVRILMTSGRSIIESSLQSTCSIPFMPVPIDSVTWDIEFRNCAFLSAKLSETNKSYSNNFQTWHFHKQFQKNSLLFKHWAC